MVLLSLIAINILRKALQGRAEFPKAGKTGAKFLSLSSLLMFKEDISSGIRKGTCWFNSQNIGKKKKKGWRYVQDRDMSLEDYLRRSSVPTDILMA